MAFSSSSIVPSTINSLNPENLFSCLNSRNHIEVNLYEYGLYDKNILNSLIDNYVKYENIGKNVKCVVFHHFENSSALAQIILKKLIDISNKTSFSKV